MFVVLVVLVKKILERFGSSGFSSYLCAMFQWFLRKRRISRLCQEYARQHGMLREYRIARANGCSPEEALEEWDLLTNEIMMKIQAERNQLIDIELPPPTTGTAQ